MPRTKGSKNKKVIVKAKPLSNFKSLEVKETKTEVFEIGISKADIEAVIMKQTKNLCNFNATQQFEKQIITYDKKGNMFITLINPIDLPKIKETIIKVSNEKSTNSSDQK
jgi:hypothetical protein